MNSTQPPRFATWLLHRLVSGDDQEAIAGDLLEQYRQGRSDAWYWRQAMSAIVVDAWREISSHKLLALRAVTTSWAVMWAFRFLALYALRGRHFTVVEFSLLNAAPAVLTGWIVGRLHRPQGLTFVFVSIAWWLAWHSPHLASQVVNALDHERYVPYLKGDIINTTLVATCFLSGGLLSLGKLSGENRKRTESLQP